MSTSKKALGKSPLIIAVIFVLGLVLGNTLSISNSKSSGWQSLNDNITVSITKMEQLYKFLENRYVDEVSFGSLTDEAIKNALKSLDPHSNYVSADEVRKYNDKLNGNYFGLGVETVRLENKLFISKVYDKTPASEQDLYPGDQILSVNSIDINPDKNWSLKNVMAEFTTMRPDIINLKVKKRETDEIQELEILKSRVHINSVPVAFMLNDKIGYMKIKRFNTETYSEFMRQLEFLVDGNGMEDLILDLRDNPGGYLNQVINILSQFYPNEEILLCTTEGINNKKISYKSSSRTFYRLGKVVVLVNEKSASGSEVMAGAFQDTDRGLVIGVSSYGKGLVQERYRFVDGSEIRLTTSRYYTPSGRSLQKDYVSSSKPKTQSSGKFFSTAGRPLDSGCGIVPDIYIPQEEWTDTLKSSIDLCLFSEEVLDGPSELHVLTDSMMVCLMDKGFSDLNKDYLFMTLGEKLYEEDEALLDYSKHDLSIQRAVTILQDEASYNTLLGKNQKSVERTNGF